MTSPLPSTAWRRLPLASYVKVLVTFVLMSVTLTTSPAGVVSYVLSP
ncbi:hypothetical protein [Sorangium sp. So ce1024]